MKKVYITRQIPEAGINILKQKFHVEIFPESHPIDHDLLVQKVADCDALVCLLNDRIDRAVIESGKKLRIIANYAVGYNNIDIDFAREKKIMVTNTPGVLTRATSEIAFALLITMTRQIIPSDQCTRQGNFIGWDPMLFLGDELSGKTIGIIGMGRIGQDMASLCRAFGMKIIYHNRNRLDPDIEEKLNATYSSLDELLKHSDMISIHAPLTNTTRHLINENAFDLMKQGAYIVNTARGEIIKESALIAALKSGKIKGTGLDVYEFEPKFSNELAEMENVVLLPHIGSATIETRTKMSVMAAENVQAALEGNRPEYLVPEIASLW
ncbi:D-glycerate dehydrogenase [Desulfobacterales bacterium HSG16]|nr:D-glycerate dehydrogenase [Desulfobacterales bacterium HSG16]